MQTETEHSFNEYSVKFEFFDSKSLDLFIGKVRERKLLGKFQPGWIYPDGKKSKSLGRDVVVRLWEKEGQLLTGSALLSAPKVTLTFLYANKLQVEWDLESFGPAELAKRETALFRLPELAKGETAVKIRKTDVSGKTREITFLFLRGDNERELSFCVFPPLFLRLNSFVLEAYELHQKFNTYHPRAGGRQRLPSLDQAQLAVPSGLPELLEQLSSSDQSTRRPTILAAIDPQMQQNGYGYLSGGNMGQTINVWYLFLVSRSSSHGQLLSCGQLLVLAWPGRPCRENQAEHHRKCLIH
jgi:hypothetical protein